MKARLGSMLGLGLLLVGLSVGMGWQVLSRPEVVFAFNDGSIEQALAPGMRHPEAFFRRWDNQFFFGNAIGVSPLNTNGVLETLLGPHQFRRWGVVASIVFAGLAGAWASRQFGRSRTAAGLSAILFALCGWTASFAVSGLTGRSFSTAWALLSIGMLERSRRRGGWLGYLIAGGFLGLCVSDTPDVGVLLAFACAGFFVLSHWPTREGRRLPVILRRGGLLAAYTAAAILLAVQMLIIMKSTALGDASPPAADTAASPTARYDWATQWSLPKAETWSLIACDYHGASNRSPESPYWGQMGRTPGWEELRQGFRNFRLSGYAMGAVPFAMLLGVGMLLMRRPLPDLLQGDDRRMAWVFAVLAALCLMLAWGRHFPLYRLFFSLPMMSSIRNPDKWLGGFVVFSGLAFALAVDVVLAVARRPRSERRKAWLAMAPGLAVLPVLAVLGLLALKFRRMAFEGRLQSDGYPDGVVEAAWENAVSANLQVLVISLLVAGAVAVLLRVTPASDAQAGRRATIWGAALGAMIAVELIRAGLPFMMPHPYQHLLRENPLTEYLETRRHQGLIKTLPSEQPLLNQWRLTYLRARGLNLFDPVSVRALPGDYRRLFETLAASPLRLWQLGSVRYFLCMPEIAEQLERIGFSPQLELGVDQQGPAYIPTTQVPEELRFVHVLEFPAAVPPVYTPTAWTNLPDSAEGDAAALARLADPAFDPRHETILQAAGLPESGAGPAAPVAMLTNTTVHAAYQVDMPADGLLVRTVKHHPDWEVTIDGNPAPLLRANFLLQAVQIPAGDHHIEFSFRPSQKPLAAAAIGRLLLLCALILYFARPRPAGG